MRLVFQIVLVCALVTSSLAGCQRTTRIDVPISGMKHRADLGVDIEVVNWAGSVTVVADPRYSSTQVLQRVRRLDRTGPKGEELRQQVTVSAEGSIDGGRRLLRVRSTPLPEADVAKVAVDVIVRVSKADDVRVSNTRGPVSVSGFSGSLNVENGPSGAPGGDIQARTQRGVSRAVSLVTTQGNVIYKCGPGSRGSFDMMGGGQMPEFVAKVGSVSNARPDPLANRYRAVLDGGTNPIMLRSEKGGVLVEVIENAGTAGPELWDGWPSMDRGPRIFRPLAILAGERPADQKPKPRGPAVETPEPFRW